MWAADTEADAEDALIHRGIELRRQGNDRAALDELERAYAIKRSPHAAAQLGFVEQALGLWPQAEQHVREALAAKDAPWVRKNRATVDAALATIRAHIGHVQIDGGVAGRPGDGQRTARRVRSRCPTRFRSAPAPSTSRCGPPATRRR